MNKGESKFELSELFMAAADRDRRFLGTIKRGFDFSGHPIVWGRIEVNSGFICAQAANQDVLGERLDEILKMVLDKGLHESGGVTSEIANTTYFLN